MPNHQGLKFVALQNISVRLSKPIEKIYRSISQNLSIFYRIRYVFFSILNMFWKDVTNLLYTFASIENISYFKRCYDVFVCLFKPFVNKILVFSAMFRNIEISKNNYIIKRKLMHNTIKKGALRNSCIQIPTIGCFHIMENLAEKISFR